MNVQQLVPELFEWIEVFKTGNQVDSHGHERTWTESDLTEIVQNFQPNTFTVPIILGHQNSDKSPAYGWVSSLKKEGDRLYAKLANVLETFAISFKNKQYPNRSVRIDVTDRGLELGHLAFLGATPPAIDLQPIIQFKRYLESFEYPVPSSPEVNQEVKQIEFKSLITGGLNMALLNNTPPKDTGDPKEATPASSEKMTPNSKPELTKEGKSTESIEYELAIETPAPAMPPAMQPAAPPPPAQPKPTAPPGMVIMSEHERQLLLNQGVASAAEAMLSSAQLYVNQLQAAGKVTPALLDGIADFICFLERLDSPNPIFAYAAAVNPKSVSKQLTYTDGQGNSTQVRPVDYFKALLQKLPTQVDLNKRHEFAAMPVADQAAEFESVVNGITRGFRIPKPANTPPLTQYR